MCIRDRQAQDLVKTKLELGEDYGMRGASALGKEWYEHSEGFCDALKGKTRTEIAGLSGGDADLKALCTIDITDQMCIRDSWYAPPGGGR